MSYTDVHEPLSFEGIHVAVLTGDNGIGKSAFIQQGRADTFTTNSPAERKRILAEILELGYYDELEGRAKERFKSREAQLGDERRLEEGWAQEIARRPDYQSELERLRVQLASLETQVGRLDEQTTLARDLVTQLEALQQQVEETAARLQRFSVDRARISST